MKIVIVNGSMPHYDHGLGRVVSVVASTVVELGMEVDEINLGFAQIPYCDGMRAQVVDDMAARLQAASGVVFACTAQLFAPSAMMQTFLEFLECPDYRGVLAEKHCMFAVVSQSGGERSALEYLARTVCHLGGYESGKIGLQEAYARTITDESGHVGSIRDIIEKETEDFYRSIRQNRRYIMPTDSVIAQQVPVQPPVQMHVPIQAPVQPQIPAPAAVPAAYAAAMQPPPPPPPPPPPQPATKLNLEAFTEQQEQDIKELTALFSQKYAPPAESQYVVPSPAQAYSQPAIVYQPPTTYQPPHQMPPIQAAPPTPRAKTVKQLTQSLPHYYQPQVAAGMTAVIQFSITGAETFDGYLTIVNNECEYTDGQAENPEITIIADSNTWSDVLKGKHTAQKAFMIGGLKVRGNFVLLTKFDSIFKM